MKNNPSTGLTLNQFKFFLVGVLVFFKLAPENGISHWSWWWITAPLWVADVVVILAVGVIFMLAVFAKAIDEIINSKNQK